jgi:isopropylmalate/homocitrate/citramalate synthase
MILSDVTIREGGQMPGRTYSVEERLAAGLALDDLGVDYIQPGFAVASEADFGAIERLAPQCDAKVVSLARAVESDVERSLEADADVVEVFAPVSRAQLTHMVDRSREEILASLESVFERAHDTNIEAHLTLVDAFRTDLDNVVDIFERFPDVADVGHVGLADTVGGQTPNAVADFLAALADRGVSLDRAGVHFHDDLGVATANALEAASAGVGKADVSVASLGERAGNTALEELVVAGFLSGTDGFGVRAESLVPVCREVLAALDEDVDDRKAVLGPSVTRHESGIHVAAMLSDPGVMEPFDPGRFGGSRTLMFGGNTGRSGARKLLERVGRDTTAERVDRLIAKLEEAGPVDLDDALALADTV